MVFNIDQNVIQSHYNEDIKFFNEDLIDIALKTDYGVRQAKKHHLILQVALFGIKDYFLLIIFPNSHLIIDIS